MAKEINIETIDRPYNAFLERSLLDSDRSLLNVGTEPDVAGNQITPVGGDTSSSGGSSGLNGSVNDMPVKTDGSIGDVWIKNFIRSENWKPKSVGFAIDGQTGYAEFTNVYVSGDIQALTGHIGGWVINTDSITDLSGTTGMSSVITGGDDIRFWAGDVVPANAEFSVTEAGVLKATSGTIGGNVLSPTSISSTTFVSGPLGAGWNISNTGTAEFQNVTIRGTIRTSVFEKDTISAVNGIVMISKADILSIDMTALDASTLTISGQTSFVINEVIRIKDGTDDEYMLVTDVSGSPTYIVTRDLAGSYGVDSNPIWKKGTAIVSIGVGTGTKTGYVLLDSSSSNSPYIDVYGRNSNTYTDTTLHGRFGWLKGIVDADVGLNSTDVWGLYTDNAYLKGTIVATSGKFGSLTNYWNVSSVGLTAVSTNADIFLNYGKTDFGQDSTSGFILGYDYSASVSKFEIGSSSSIMMKYDGTNFTINGGIITGGLIRTGTGANRMEFTSYDNSIDIYTGGSFISAIQPNSVQGKGCSQWFYDDTNTNNDVGELKFKYTNYAAGVPGGYFKSQELYMFLRSFSGGTGVAVGLISDNQDPTKVRMFLGGGLQGNISNYTGASNSLGSSTDPFYRSYATTVYYGTLTNFSDQRLKKNIKTIGYGLKEILQLNPVDFNWKKDNKKSYGFIAQEVRNIIPELVSVTTVEEETFEKDENGNIKIKKTEKEVKIKDDPEGESSLEIDVTPIVPMLVRSIQELNTIIEGLKVEIDNLKNKP